MGRLFRKLRPGEVAGEPYRLLTKLSDIILSPDDPRLNVGDTIQTSGGGTITLANKAEALAYHRNPAKFLAANADRIVPPPKILPEPKVQLRRGRPPTGRTPDKDRSAKSKAALLEAGGRRANVNLKPRAAEALATLQKRLGGATATEAIEHALLETAKRRRA